MRFPQLRRARWAALLALLAVLSAQPALAQGAVENQGITEERVGAIAFDVLLLRPMGFLQVVIGVAIFPIAWVLAVPGERESEVIELLITVPVQHTFTRPLGELS